MMGKRTIIRLSRYKNALQRFKRLGFVKVFSDNLADAIGGTPSQVRKDFSMFGITGNRRGGYNVDELLGKLNDILGKGEIHNVVLVGAGNIGNALINYKGFEKEGVKIAAAFDIDPASFSEGVEVPVLPLSSLKDFIKEHNIKIGIIAVPDIAAQQVFDIMTQSGIKGVMNFAPICLRTTEDVVISNINLGMELENIIYFVNAQEQAKG